MRMFMGTLVSQENIPILACHGIRVISGCRTIQHRLLSPIHAFLPIHANWKRAARYVVGQPCSAKCKTTSRNAKSLPTKISHTLS